ncbi:uncharacterized protein LOC116341532 isoform X1 [Contarinia nasturtii]|uniref:uncharacterized protein LOC116341532 isoform X1 n=1 Tax=Contarinia nasturtii TaxID=265458 RepID=UPI0012D4B855|nr:uncharacterized protein LOC116341532 isoform X1 [Contarinia nasturtii]
MWKILSIGLLLVALSASGKVVPGKIIGPIGDISPTEWPVFGSYFVNKYAKLAREIVHKSNTSMLGTIAVQKPLKGYPMIDLIQVADSKWNETSTGFVNFYLQKSDPIYENIKKKKEVSASFSNETTQFNNETSQMETVGYRVLVTGYVVQIPADTMMFNDTNDAILDRHPDAAPVLSRLNTILVRLEIDQVCVIDDVSGPFCLPADSYYNADVDE